LRALLNSETGNASIFVIIIFLLVSSLAFVIIRFKAISGYETRYTGDLLRVVEALDAGREYAIKFFPQPVKFELDLYDVKVFSGSFDSDFTNVPASSWNFVPAFSSEELEGIPLVVEVTAQRKERTGFARRAKVYYYWVLSGK